MSTDPTFHDEVRRGLTAPQKSLPPHLFYDDVGSRLYERITELDEYYLTRTERAILTRHAPRMLSLALLGSSLPVHVVELGAGSADKTRLVLSAAVALRGPTTYLPIDVSASALALARSRIEVEIPEVRVLPFVGRHEEALGAIAELGPRRLVMFIGSSIGNFEDDDAVRLLGTLRRGLEPDDALLLGTDMRKSPARLVAAYDDALGVTAEFNKNLLRRINRELGGGFDLDRFAHVALWNEPASRIEMHLESLVEQEVRIDALDLQLRFAKGERIHTESSVKYDQPRVDRILERSGFARAKTFMDDEEAFSVHLCRAVA